MPDIKKSTESRMRPASSRLPCKRDKGMGMDPVKTVDMVGLLDVIEGSARQPAAGAQVLTDSTYFRLALFEGGRAGVNRVVAERELVRVLDRGSDNEGRLALGGEFKGVVGVVEHGDGAGGNWRGSE